MGGVMPLTEQEREKKNMAWRDFYYQHREYRCLRSRIYYLEKKKNDERWLEKKYKRRVEYQRLKQGIRDERQAAYSRAYRQRQLTSNPQWREQQRQRANTWAQRKKASDPQWHEEKLQYYRIWRQRKKAADPHWLERESQRKYERQRTRRQDQRCQRFYRNNGAKE
jgi:hypothetical protein